MNRTVLSCVLSGVFAVSALTANASETATGFYLGLGGGVFKPKSDDSDFDTPHLNSGIIQFGYNFSENFAVEATYASSQKKTLGNFSENYDATSEVKTGLVNMQSFTSAQISNVQSAVVNASAKADISVDVTALYAVYRTSGNLYAKFKAGPASVEASAKASAKTSWNTTIASAAPANLIAAVKSLQNQFDENFQDGFYSEVDPTSSARETKFAAGIGAGYKFHEKFSAELEYTKVSQDIDFMSLNINYMF